MKYKAVLLLAVLGLLFSVVAQAQSNALPPIPSLVVHPSAADSESINTRGGIRPDITETCSYTFTNAGTGNSYMEFCVTVNGNIVSFQSPNGVEYISQGGFAEGYGICDTSTGVNYYDYAYEDSGNWNAPVLVSSSATSVKISRSTSDGLFTLTQTIAKVAGTAPYARITMALRNNVKVAKTVYFLRYGDVDPPNAYAADTNFAESFDSTYDSAWGYTPLNYSGPDYAGYGLKLSVIGAPTGTTGYSFEGIGQKISAGPTPCNPTANYAGYQASVDGSVELWWDLGIGGLKTATMNAKYEEF